nr:response regulator [Nitrosomonas nitrosa]
MNAPLILIVDDEEQVGMFASIFLKRAGFRTLRASNARSALGLFTDEIDILLTDWAMPDMTGGDLAAQLLERKPTLRVLFMSGNAELPMQPGSTLEPGVNFIQKPFVSEDLIALVRQALIPAREPVPAS